VCEITEETLKPYVDKVLGKILRKGMTQREQARAIYDWMIANVSYTAYTYKDHWMRAAYYGFVNGRGDCYVYYAMSRALLDGAGIENMEICRDNPAKPHYWNLVNCGDGWYHFDTCPHYKSYPLESFMLTDREVEEYSKNCVEEYYSFDKSLYPATP
jgi:transglutaminase/protease-like cytokinesis protein 3